MNELTIQRFYRVDGGTVFIDIKLHYYREVFNTWDFSPLLNRDLDDDLFEYLEECVREIPKRNTVEIALHLPKDLKDRGKESMNTESFRNFFDYKIRKLQIMRRELYSNTFRYSLFGILFISLGYFLENGITPHSGLIKILREGFFIGGWVLFWELFSTIFFRKSDIKKTMTSLTRLKNAAIVYEYS